MLSSQVDAAGALVSFYFIHWRRWRVLGQRNHRLRKVTIIIERIKAPKCSQEITEVTEYEER